MNHFFSLSEVFIDTQDTSSEVSLLNSYFLNFNETEVPNFSVVLGSKHCNTISSCFFPSI